MTSKPQLPNLVLNLKLMYNTMMTKTHTLRSLCLIALIVPGTVLAYMSPEEVLTSDQNQMYWNPPPSARQTELMLEQQQSNDAALRAAAQRSSSSSVMTSSSVDNLHGAAPDQAVTLSSESSSLTEQDLIDQRILERLKQNRIDAQLQMLQSQESLHSGAQLAPSGPGTTLSLLVLAVAGLWTIWRARRMEKKI